jgi:hypothetical protein
MLAGGEVMEEMRESHQGMVDGCRWSGGGMGYRFASAWRDRQKGADKDEY